MTRPRVGLLWRAEWDPPQAGDLASTAKLRGVFAAFAAVGVAAEPVVYSDADVEAVRDRLLRLDGVLVWVNPLEQGLDRSTLDRLLRAVADAGVWVSAHPDVIARLATKQVLVDTRELSWSADTRLYRSAAELRAELPARLASGPRVLKQQRGMGGQGVWKVEARDGAIRLEQAADGTAEVVGIEELALRFAPYFAGGRVVVEQAFVDRIADGMIRAYLTHDRVVGFAHQYPRGFRPASAGEPPPGKVFELPDAPRYAALRAQLESEWVPGLQRILSLAAHELPVIWDADFLYGPRTAAGDDTYVLCEINASSTFAFPEHAMPGVARAALERIAERQSRSATAQTGEPTAGGG